MKKINKDQLRKYLGEWGRVRKLLRSQGVEPIDADRERHACHVRALGRDKSSIDFTNADLDAVLAAFRAIYDPSNITTQIDQEKQAVKRSLWRIGQLCKDQGKPQAYAEGIARKMNAEGKLGTPFLEDLDPAGLKKVIIALTVQSYRKKPAISPQSDPDLDPAEDDGDPF